MRKRLLSLLFLALLAGPGAALAASGPTEQLQVEVERILELLNDKSLDREVRNEKIAVIVKDRFDFQTMGQWILGVNWRRADEEQRKRFVDRFAKLLEATYRDRIEAYADEYTDEQLRFTGEQIRDDKAMVDTLVITESAEIPISYKLVLNDGKWEVYDVVIEKVSLIRNYRSTYDEIIRKEGFEGLFRRMEEKIEELRLRPAGEGT